MTFGERIKMLRKQRKMTQGALALRIGSTQASISGWETQAAEPTFDVLSRIADVFGVTTDYLIGRTNVPFVSERPIAQYMEVTEHEKQIIEAYREKKEMHPAICQLLGVRHPATEISRASRA